jgi:nucleotide-binding universal stress UspA family protein
MVVFTHVLYPTDLSEAARPALRYAAAVARWYNTRLTVLHVVPTFDGVAIPSGQIGAPSAVVYPPSQDEVLGEMRQAVRLDALAGIDATFAARAGDPARQIVDQAVEGAADLIVMGTHGRGGFDRLLSGSVTEKVLRRAPCPVLTIPPHAPPGREAEAIFARILCPMDFSPSAQQALGFALDLARQSNGSVTVATVIEWLAEEEPRVYEHFNVSEYRQHLIDDARGSRRWWLPSPARGATSRPSSRRAARTARCCGWSRRRTATSW